MGALVSLSSLLSHTKARIMSFAGGREFRNHLFSMGLNIGADVEVIKEARTQSGSTLIKARGAKLMLGHGMAEKILVEVEK